MQFKSIIVLMFLFVSSTFAQEVLTGLVCEEINGVHTPLQSVTLQWAGTTSGTVTDAEGKFSLPLNKKSNTLIVSMIGYATDTVVVTDQRNIDVMLVSESQKTGDVNIVANKSATYQDYNGLENKSIMSTKELAKAACCNLSESFETNPSMDVSFTDAITGTKQIEMLGLSGIYTQTTLENLPFMRGLMSNVGLTYIPGTWVNAINVAKGIGSVANGYESITGQIDVDLQKPHSEFKENLLVNVYGDNEQRFEGNLNYRHAFSDKLSAITLLHASQRKYQFDHNTDTFSDLPTFSTYNVMQRWQLHTESGWEGNFGFQYVNDSKGGGSFDGHSDVQTVNPHRYQYSTDNEQLNVYGKFGYVFQSETYRSFGIQWSYNDYKTSSLFGNRNYNGKEKTGYVNFLYQSEFSKEHKYRLGVSYLFDKYNETFLTNNFKRVESVPGAFLEYTYSPMEELNFNLGIRGDKHNYYGYMVTPRLHVRYAPEENWVFRLAAGKGYRTSNIFQEFSPIFASNRNVNINASEDYGYGLKQESAWNYGLNLTHYFYYDYREGTISVDLYRTNFDQVTIADLETSPQQINFASVKNGSYSNSLQVEINFEPLERLTTRLAYRYMDVKQNVAGNMIQRAFSSKNRALINLGYSTEKESADEDQMLYDLTVQWFDKKRIPSTASNPVEFQSQDFSPSFTLVNAQVTRAFSFGVDFYLGVENIFDFKQKDIIIDPMNPHSEYFDASLIWGPTNGRLAYAGFRYRL